MKMKRLIMAIATLLAFATAQAQDLDQIKEMIDQGQYKQAAMKLRPLADGGDAEAQYLAATLFLEGKGVNKSEVQGVKYATKAIEQGYNTALAYLYHYFITNNKASNAFSLIKKYTNDGEKKIRIFRLYLPWKPEEDFNTDNELFKCYYEGIGTTKDVERAWTLYEKVYSINELWDRNVNGVRYKRKLNTDRYGHDYIAYQMDKAGIQDSVSFVGHLFETGQHTLLTKYIVYIEHFHNQWTMRKEADSGNIESAAILSWFLHYNYGEPADIVKETDLYEADNKARMHIKDIKNYSSIAAKGGSKMGEYIGSQYAKYQDNGEVNGTRTYTNIKAMTYPNLPQGQNIKILSVSVRPKNLTIQFEFSSSSSTDIWLDPNTFITCMRQNLRLIHSTLPSASNKHSYSRNTKYRYAMTFERLPQGANAFNLTSGSLFWRNIQLY